MRSAISSRPPGRNTRTASSIAFSRRARALTLCIAALQTTKSKLSRYDRRGGVGPHAAGDRPGRGRPDRDDRPSASTSSTRAHLAPGSGSSDWTARSLTANRPLRVDLVLDGTTGEVKNRLDFWDRHLADRIVGTCLAAHGGRLFGWPNQLLGAFTASGLIVLSASAVVMWWRRREPGALGARGSR